MIVTPVTSAICRPVVSGIFGGAAQSIPTLVDLIEDLIVWYQPSDLTTLYQDAYGLLAVSADADPVGLMLDKSQRLALGAELFDSAWDTEDWTDNGGGSWTLDNTSGSGDEDLTYDALYTVGNVYETRFTLSGVSGGDVEIALGTSAEFHTQDANGSYVFRHVATDATLMRIRLPIGSAATVSGISVREITGNHVWQATDANRPVYKTAGSVHWIEKTSSTQTMGGKTDAITVNANYYIAAGLEVTGYQPSGSVTYTMLGAGISTATTRKTLAMRLGTGTTRIFTSALRVGGGTQYLASASNGAFNLDTKYVFEAYHESNTLSAAIDAGTPATTAATEASSGTATLVFMETGSGSVRFYGGLITSEAASTEEKAQARGWINNQMGDV